MTEYIEKQAALDIVSGWRDQLIPTYGNNDEYVKCLETVAEHLGSLHAADVRPVVRGEWIDDGCITRCKYCGEEKGFPHWRFCPVCGADLRR